MNQMEEPMHPSLKEREGAKERTLTTVTGGRAILPVTEITGTRNGPSVLITAGIHGGEYPGMVATMEISKELSPEDIAGRVTFIHSANPCAFWARRPELNEEDKKNLNREFPGTPHGSPTQKLAWHLMQNYILRADYYMDLHSGDIHEDLCPHVYYSRACTPEVSKASKRMALHVDVPYMVPSMAAGGAYNCGALHHVPSILIERGGNGICRREDIDGFKADIRRILHHLGVLVSSSVPITRIRHDIQEVRKVIYVMAREDSCWLSPYKQGDRIAKGAVLGESTNLFGDTRHTYLAEEDGVMLYLNTSLALLKGKVAAAYAVVE